MQKDISKNFNAFSTNKGNVIWMGTMSLCWQQFAKFHSVDKLQFDNTNPSADRTINNLNNTKFSSKQINSDCIYVKAGKGPQTQKTINDELYQQFPNCSFPSLAYDLKQESIISFAYLFKKLTFQQKFERRAYKNFMFGETKVESFYAEEDQQKEQIKVHDYKGDDQFCISIADKDNKDAMFFLKTDRTLTVDEVISQITNMDSKTGAKLRTQDKFEMPIVQIDVSRQYEQMKGATLRNGKSNGQIAVMAEALKLKIDQEGAKVESKASCIQDECAIMYIDTRHYYLNKKFWVVMKQVGKFPYLCVHINDPTET